MMNDQKGQALPLVLLVLAIGVLLIAPFLGHAGSSLIGSRIYGQAITEQYSADAGIDHAIWRLTYDGLAAQLPFPGDSRTYDLSEAVNGLTPSVTVTAMGSSDGDGSYIYALQGNDQKDFWRYDIANDAWTPMADALDNVKEGGALTHDGSYIYAFRGDNREDFWRYDIANDAWASMADAPENVKEGGALTSDGSYIYALRGNDKKNFWKYDIANDAWPHMANTPENVKDGGALASSIVTSTFNEYEIVSTAGDYTIRAVIKIEGETVSILSWEVE